MVTVDDDVGPVVEAVGRLNVFAQAFEPAVDALSGIRTSVDGVAESTTTSDGRISGFRMRKRSSSAV